MIRWAGGRGVTPAVACGYLDLVRPFAERHAVGGSAGLRALTAGDVTAFLIVGGQHPALRASRC
jgi:hypothetical protein